MTENSSSKAVALDPNTDPEQLAELFKTAPWDVLNNPALELILLEKPDFF